MKKYFGVLLITAIIGGGTAVSAQTASPSPSVVAQDLSPSVGSALISDLVAGKWVMAFGGLIMIAVYLLRTYVLPKELGSGAYPWISMGLGMLCALGSSLLGGMNTSQAINVALMSGPTAQALYNQFVKLISKKPAA
jgi:hypothetical protein